MSRRDAGTTVELFISGVETTSTNMNHGRKARGNTAPLRARYSNARRRAAVRAKQQARSPLSLPGGGRDENFTCATGSRMMATICKRRGVPLSVT